MKKCFLTILYILSLSKISISQIIPVDQENYISIGGIEQWVTIKGDDITKPVILFLHGGPGSVMSPYAKAIFNKWEKDFILVQWDQRGAGRTFAKNAPADVNEDYWIENPLSIRQMTSDAIELSEYLVKHFKKQKIIIIGTSWGSILGVKIALERPDLYYAYLAHSQVVKSFDSHTYDQIMKMAKKSNDITSIEKLNSIGSPPYNDAKNAGQFLRIIKKYEKENSVPAPAVWWQISTAYNNETDSKYREDGDDYSFINYVGHKQLGIKAMITEVNFMKEALMYKVPVYFIQGEHDILTPKEITKEYFDKISAPEKKFQLIPGAAHGFNEAVVDALLKILKSLGLK